MAGWVTHCSLVTGGYYSYSDWVETTRHCPQCPLSTEHGTRLTSPEMRLYLEELEVWVLIVYQKSIISLPCQEPIFLLLSNILLSIKSYIDRSAGAFETCIIRWNLLIFLCDLTHWHCPLCPKNVGFEIFNRKQFKNWVAISIFYKNKSWNIFNHQIYMNSVSSKTSDKDFCYILSKAWTLLLTIQYFKNFLIFSVWGQYLMWLKYKAEVAIMHDAL